MYLEVCGLSIVGPAPLSVISGIWAIPAETTILPSKHDTGPCHILFLQILYFFT